MLGIAGNGMVFTGPELDKLTPDALRALARECNVFARASPENKLKIVRVLQVSGGVLQGRTCRVWRVPLGLSTA